MKEVLTFFPYAGRVGRVEITWRPGGSAMPASPVTPNGPSTPSHPAKMAIWARLAKDTQPRPIRAGWPDILARLGRAS